ncbi:cupin domain-containing protein [Umezawaea endophytica]|uniref:Cupin domain-containing protein n=1 Tax=Umezawaea endophytica TaxID=1654476 RepID=A0A9X2VH02_9PSEU|nr:cupin domain-containing protein [Umezawaea endophytica]MCS7475974.1 cupin domain-containing protein [Umezawaea endophytica]
MRSAVLRRALVVGAVAVAWLGGLAGVSSATPGTGVSAKLLFQKTVGDKDYVVREITIQPGGATGWHFHDGRLFGVVKSGTLTHYDDTCSVDGVYRAGESITESGGAEYVHIGRNLGTTPMVLEVLYVNPAGSPLSRDADAPACDR